MEKEELRTLAPYANKSSQSNGRAHREKESLYRTAFQRDRDRIIHSSAFRRLEYKTQVFVNHEGDHYRTRLTHTLEASQISRVIARVLRLNPDLVETITLAHDLGHTPFGHAGEDELAMLMKNYGGFDHNLQSLRVVDYLENRYPEFRGLNLTYESRVGLFKHPELVKKAEERGMGPFYRFHSPSLESQVVDIADEIAYDNHDVDDGLASGLLEEKDLDKLALWRGIKKSLGSSLSANEEIRRSQIIRGLIGLEVTDLVEQSHKNIRRAGIKTVDQAMQHPKFLIGFSKDIVEKREELRGFMRENLYKHPKVVRMTDNARKCIKALFKVYLTQPENLGAGARKRIQKEGIHRVVCDYIAGMTDRFAQNEYKKFF